MSRRSASGARWAVGMCLAVGVGAAAALSGCAAPTAAVPRKAPVTEEQIGVLRPARIPPTAIAPGVRLDEPTAAPAISDSLALAVRSRIDAILRDPVLARAQVSLLVEPLRGGPVLYERSADTPLIPASNMKIVTAALALSVLGPSYAFETDLATDGEQTGSTLAGNLYVRGRGDPSLTTESVWKLVEELEALGIERIMGDVVLDASYFDSLSMASGKASEGDRAYHARVGALAVNFGSIAVRVRPGARVGDPALVSLVPATDFVRVVNRAETGSSRRPSTIDVRRSTSRGRNTVTVTGRVPAGSSGGTWNRNVDDPTGHFGALFMRCLSRAGIVVDGCAIGGVTPGGAAVLATHRSKPLGVILRDVNKQSNNFVAEQLLKAVSARVLGPPGTTAGGASLAAGYLAAAGADSGSFVVADGSGLSRDNRLTGRTILLVLREMLGDYGAAAEFVSSLAVGGLDGTLARRLSDEGLRGAVRGKTGLLNGVTALSGIVHTATRGDLVFSMITNGFEGEQRRAHEVEERVLAALGGL